MSKWFCNYITISEISLVNLAKLKSMINGDNYPYHAEAICKATKLLIAGYAGILEPSHVLSPLPHLALIDHFNAEKLDARLGGKSFENTVYTEFLELLKPDLKLTRSVSEKIIELYDQSRLADLKWSMLADYQQKLIAKMFYFKGTDWFGIAVDEYNDLSLLWSSFDKKPVLYQRFDMRFVVPSYLLAEINGKGTGIFKHLDRSISLFEMYGLSGSIAYCQSWDLHQNNGIILRFDTPFLPPRDYIFIELSNRYQCRIEHIYTDYQNHHNGGGRYQNGQIVDLLSK